MLPLGGLEGSRYIRSSSLIDARVSLSFKDSSQVRFFSADEATKLAEQIRKHNLFARHPGSDHFYIQRARALADRTIIEVFRPGLPTSISEVAESAATRIERIVVLSSAIALKKADLLRKIGIATRITSEINLSVGPGFQSLRSRARRAPPAQGILLNQTFQKRFARCGFLDLTHHVLSSDDMARRTGLSLDWLFESRIEPRLPASVVKTAIALESLLILSESEPLTQSLSERAAFIISPDPVRRQLVNRILRRFYGARSAIVHGAHKPAKAPTPELLEAVDRLAILLCLIVASNSRLWSTPESLREWSENQRWGSPDVSVEIPFADSYLRAALALGQSQLTRLQ